MRKTYIAPGEYDPDEGCDLLPAEEIPFNLAGEPLDNSLTAEGEARVRALAEAEARKAQRLLYCTHTEKASCDCDWCRFVDTHGTDNKTLSRVHGFPT